MTRWRRAEWRGEAGQTLILALGGSFVLIAGALADCGCVPPIPETQAYVSSILGLLGGSGALLLPVFQVRLVA